MENHDLDNDFAGRPKKSLGQNFLTSKGALEKIAETADIKNDDIILEIGPGKGALTHEILNKKPKKVLAVEKDESLIPFLAENFKENIQKGELILKNRDILEFDEEKEELLSPKYKVVANIPYYITGQFIRKFLSSKNKPEKMVLLVQKEVAERITARDGKESVLSNSVKVYGEPHFIEKVKKGSFFPAPNVDSAILLIDKIIDNFKNDKKEKRFFEMLHAGFAQKRKMLLGNLSGIFGGRESAEKIILKCKINPKDRAENLKLENWLCLSEN